MFHLNHLPVGVQTKVILEDLSDEVKDDLTQRIEEHAISMCTNFSKCLTLVQSGSVTYLSQGVELLLTLFNHPELLSQIVPFVERAISHNLSTGTLDDIRTLHSLVVSLRNEGVSLDIKATLDNNAESFDWTISESDPDTDDLIEFLGERLTNGRIRIIFDADWNGKNAPDWLKMLLAKSVYQRWSNYACYISFDKMPDSFNRPQLELEAIFNNEDPTQFTKLNLSNMTEIPETISNLVNLEELELRGSFTSLPESIGTLTKLTILKCDNNSNLSTLPASLCNCTALTKLSIANTSVSALPAGLQKSTLDINAKNTPVGSSYIAWRLQYDSISILDDTFKGLSWRELRRHTFTTEEFKFLNTSFLEFIATLEDLSAVQSIPLEVLVHDGMSVLKHFSSLEDIDALNDKTREHPFDQAIIDKLASFDATSLCWNFPNISNDAILTSRIEQSKGLSLSKKKQLWDGTVSIHYTKRTTFPTALEKFKTMPVELSGKKIKELPTYFTNLSLDTPLLKLLCKDAASFTNLKKLDLTGCQISDVYDGFENLPALEVVHFYSNRLKSIPRCLPQIATLKELNMPRCRANIPEWISEFKHLEVLRIGNRANTIPTAIGKVTSLRELHLEWNGITELPAALNSLTNLEILNVMGSSIISIETDFKKMKSLKQVFLKLDTQKYIPDIKDKLVRGSKSKLKFHVSTRYSRLFNGMKTVVLQ